MIGRGGWRLAAAGLLLARPVPAQVAGVPVVLELPPTVRSAALNGAATALVGDAGAVFANPAGLATIRHIGIEGSFRRLPGPGARAATAALGWRLRQFDVGVGVRYADFGSSPASFLGPVVAGAASHEVMGSASLVYRFGMLAFGGTAKGIERRNADERARAVGVDAGVAVAVFDIMALAFSVQNVGGNLRDSSALVLPRLSRLGFTMNYVDPLESFRLLSTIELQWPEGGSSRLVVGGEAGVVLAGVGVIGRLGYGTRPIGISQTSFAYGLTLAFTRLNVDYAYRSEDLLGEPAHLFGVRMTL